MRLDPGTATGRDANGENLPSVLAVSLEERGRWEGRTGDCRIWGRASTGRKETLSLRETGV